MNERSSSTNRGLLVVLLAIDFIWLRSSWGKLSGGQFVGNLGTTLTKFTSANPYPFVKDFLTNTAIPNAQTFGLLTMWGEVFVAVSLFVSLIYFLMSRKDNKLMLLLLAMGLLGGMFLNKVFWWAAGYTSPSTESLNLLMFLIEAIGLIYALKLLIKK